MTTTRRQFLARVVAGTAVGLVLGPAALARKLERDRMFDEAGGRVCIPPADYASESWYNCSSDVPGAGSPVIDLGLQNQTVSFPLSGTEGFVGWHGGVEVVKT